MRTKTAAALLEAPAAAGDFVAAWAGARAPEPARAAWLAVAELFARGVCDARSRRACAGPFMPRPFLPIEASGALVGPALH
jgi:hypothetical protein